MAFADSLVLVDSADANQTFVAQSRLPGGVDFIENDATLESTRRVIIRHTNAGASVLGKGARQARRHLVQCTHEKWNATLGKMEKLTFNGTLTIDPGASFTPTNIYDIVMMPSSLLMVSTNLDKLVRDEA